MITEQEFDAIGLQFGERVKFLREGRGWSLEQLARSIDGSSSNLGKIERGQLPNVRTALALAAALELASIEELFGPLLPTSEWLTRAAGPTSAPPSTP